MKFASTLTIASIVLGANAIAVPDVSADASPAADLCNGLVKRAAEADARHRREFVWPNFCSGFVGRICGKAKRGASSEAEAVCGAYGQPCTKVRCATEAFAAALANPSADTWYSFCDDGRPCPKKAPGCSSGRG